MTLKQRIDEDIKQAMRDKNQDTLRALRAVKSLILLEETKICKQKRQDFHYSAINHGWLYNDSLSSYKII